MQSNPIRFRYQTYEFGDDDIHVRTLRDKQQFSDQDGVAEKLGILSATWSFFGVIWPSGQVLAHHMYDYEVAGKKILEVGCGIALASLVLNQRSANITATDHHPEAESFLIANTNLNNDEIIPFVRTGWEDQDSELGKFDLIIGSDLLYESNHADLLADFIEEHAGKRCEFLHAGPRRGHQAHFTRRMEDLGYSCEKSRPTDSHYLETYKGSIFTYQRG